MDTNNDSPPLEKAKVMEAVLKLSVLSYLTIEHISKNGCFSVLLVLFLILVINTIEKHCQRHNGPRHCFYNLNYLSSYKAGKFSSKENSS